MDKQELEKLISEKAKRAERERKKREYIVTAAFTIVFFLVYCIFEKVPDKIGDIITLLIVSFVLAAIHCAINHLVFGYLSERDDAAHNEIKFLKEKLSEMEKHKKE